MFRGSDLKNFFLAFVLVFAGSSVASAMRLEYVGETSIVTGKKYENATIGGLSAIVWQEGTLIALSDDKGRAGEPRFFEFDLKVAQGQVELNPKAVRFFSGLPPQGEKPAVIDPEGLVRLPGGEIIISSEGDNDAKPRQSPRLFRASEKGVWKSDLPVPDKYLPESLGQQKKGCQNNAAFEGLSVLGGGKTLYTMIESALVQDIVFNEEEKGDWLRILKYEDKGSQGFAPVAEYAYRVDGLNDTARGKEVFRGVSEILAISDNKLLVLERGVRLFSKNLWAHTIGIYIVDLAKATNILPHTKLSESPKIIAAEKKKVIDFETDLIKERGDKKIQNFEGLSWGPRLPDGRRTLLVVSDNNFSKKETTELVVFAVDGD